MASEGLIAPVGLPPCDEERKKESVAGLIAAIFFLPRIVFGSVSIALYYFVVRESADKALSQLKGFNESIGYLYLAVLLFSWLVWFQNMYPLNYESQVFAKDTGALRTNMFIFKTLDPKGSSYVALELDGPVGSYNRANRGLYHTLETAPIALANLVVLGPVFPGCMCALILVYATGRLMWQRGAAITGWPKGTMPGFLLSNLIAMNMMEGFAWVAFIQTTF